MNKLILNLFAILYILIFLGFALHTSQTPAILGKYSKNYFQLLIAIALLFLPYIKLGRLILRTNRLKLNVRLTPISKLALSFIFLIFFILIPGELLLHYKNITYFKNVGHFGIENFHPFLQRQMVQSDNIYDSRLHLNSFGFRGDEILLEKTPQTYRIFLLGSSTVLNRKVEYDKSVGKILQQELQTIYPNKKIEVLNAGVEIYNSEHTIIQYLFKISDFKPDMIISWQGLTDMTTSCLEDPDTYGPYKSDYSHKFRVIYPLVFKYFFPKMEENFAIYSLAYQFIKTSFFSDPIAKLQNKPKLSLASEPKYEARFQSINAYERNMTHLVGILKHGGVTLILGNQPYLYNPSLDDKITWNTSKYCRSKGKYPSIESIIRGIDTFNEVTKKVAANNEIQFIDLEKLLPKSLEYFYEDVHFNEKSNKIVAEQLVNRIVEMKAISN